MRGTETGGSIVLTHDPAEAVSGAEVVYADVWTSMGKDAERSDREAVFRGFTVDRRLMGPASRAWEQAANRLHTETALLYAVLTGDVAGERLP